MLHDRTFSTRLDRRESGHRRTSASEPNRVFGSGDQADRLAVEPRLTAMRSIPARRRRRPSSWGRPDADIDMPGLAAQKPSFGVSIR